jgi:diguanylate cyclase (GGDEF)-like protein/PAS domain S-box-containing protein
MRDLRETPEPPDGGGRPVARRLTGSTISANVEHAPQHAARSKRPGDVMIKSLIESMVELRFQSFLADLPDPILGVDGRGLVRFVNEQAEALFGCPQDRLIGSPAASLLRDPAALGGPSAWAHWHEAPANPQLRNRWTDLELVACRPTGSEVPVEVTLSVVGTREGLWVIAAIRDVSARKQAEEALRVNERALSNSEAAARRRLEQFMDAMPIGVVVATADGQPRYANREAMRLRGSVVMPDDRQEEPAPLHPAYIAGTNTLYPLSELPLVRALHGEASHVDDMEILQPGSTVPIEVWGTPVLSGDGSVEYAITAFADVSARRQSAEELQLLGAIVANMAEGVALIRTTEGDIAYANSSLHAMLGYEPGELVGLPGHVLDAPGESTGKEAGERITAAVFAQGSWQGEIRNVRKDGTTLWCSLNVSMFHHARLGPVFISIRTDITEQRQLQDAQARLASVVRASSDAILGKDLDGLVTSWNAGAERLFGYTSEEIVGRNIDLLVPRSLRQEEADIRGRAARGESVEQYETSRQRKDGSVVAVSVTLSPIPDRTGATVGIAAVCRDITQQKRARDELEAAAHRDALTGLGNRLCLREDLLNIHGRFVREGHAYNIALFDIDHFKDYNDTYGHLKGDALLAELGRIISSEVREGDFAYRYGGEEFLIVLPSRTLEEAASGAERIRKRVAEVTRNGELPAAVSLSGGVTGSVVGESSERTVGRADAALYRAKKAGRDQLVVDTPGVEFPPRGAIDLPHTRMPNEVIRPGQGAHLVEFYETDEFLVESVRDFLVAGLAEGETIAVVASRNHREQFREALIAAGVDVPAVALRGQYLALDASDMLSRFMAGDHPDPVRFREEIGSLIRQAGQGGRPVRVYGEMVAVLWADGMAEAAIALEELWNELALTHSFALFCAYPASAFDKDPGPEPFRRICDLHSRVIPTEHYSVLPDAAAQLREVAALQQQARRWGRAAEGVAHLDRLNEASNWHEPPVINTRLTLGLRRCGELPSTAPAPGSPGPFRRAYGAPPTTPNLHRGPLDEASLRACE